jgi:elongation factor Ts
VAARVVEGRLAKWHEEVCLLDQRFLLDDAVTVREAVARFGKTVGAPALRVGGYVRVQLGEGLSSPDGGGVGGGGGGKDFAAEVASLAGGPHKK